MINDETTLNNGSNPCRTASFPLENEDPAVDPKDSRKPKHFGVLRVRMSRRRICGCAFADLQAPIV
jgi:hypothetical protein